MTELGLVRYDAMCNAIAVCVRVDEVKEIRDKARAIEVYAAQALNTEAEQKAREIRIRAERRTGELLKETKEAGQRQKVGGAGGNNKKHTSNGATNAPRALKDLGITRDQSSDWQKLAEIPEKEFEAELKAPVHGLSTEGLLAKFHPKEPLKQPQMDVAALTAWGRLGDFERGIISRPLSELFALMTESMKDDVVRITPELIDWLEEFLSFQKAKRRRA